MDAAPTIPAEPAPVISAAEVAAAEGRIGALLDDMHREAINAMKVADRLPDRTLHHHLTAVAVAVDDAREVLAGGRS